MDPLKTVYVCNLPTGEDHEIAKALKILGAVRWERVREQGGRVNGLVQFSSGGQLTVATELLPQIALSSGPISVAMEQKTRAWLDRTADKATVQSIFRMSPSAIKSRMAASLARVPIASATTAESQNGKDILREDGTLEGDEEFAPDELEVAKKGVLEFRRQTLRAMENKERGKKERLERLQKLVEKDSANDLDSGVPENDLLKFEKELVQIDVAEVQALRIDGLEENNEALERAWRDFVREQLQADEELEQFRATTDDSTRDRRKKEAFLRVMKYEDKDGETNSPEWLTRRKKEIEEDIKDEEKERQEGYTTSKEPTPSRREFSVSLRKPKTGWDTVTSEWVDTTLRPVVEEAVVEFFGVPEESLVTFITDHIKGHKDRDSLVAELKDSLDDDTETFVTKVWSVLPGQ